MEELLIKIAALIVAVAAWLGSILLSTRGAKKEGPVSPPSEQIAANEEPGSPASR